MMGNMVCVSRKRERGKREREREREREGEMTLRRGMTKQSYYK